MNKRQRKKKQKKIQAQVIERLETLKENFKGLGRNKYITQNQLQYIFNKLIDDIKRMK